MPRSTPASPGPVASRLGLLVAVVLGVALLAGLALPLLEATLPIGRNFNEGWNARHAHAVLDPPPLYPSADALVTNNYPPLSFGVVAALGVVVGDVVHAGRLIAFLSLLVVALGAGGIVSSMTGSRGWGAASGVLVLAAMGVHFPNYVAMNDPQMLGHALQITGLTVLLRGPMGSRRLLVVALFLVAGGLVKHNLVAVPLAVSVWIGRVHPRWQAAWWLRLLGLSALACIVLLLLFGSAPFTSVLGHARELWARNFVVALERWFLPLAPLLLGTVGALALSPHDRRLQLLAGIGVLSAVGGACFSFGEGVNYNVIFDLLFVACMASTVGAARVEDFLRRESGRPLQPGRAGALWLLATSTGILLLTPARAFEFYEKAPNLPVRTEIAAEDRAFVRSRPGPLLCVDGTLAHWTDRPYEVDAFNIGQRIATGGRDGSELLGRIQSGDFAVLQLDRPDGSALFPEEVDRSIAAHYRVERHSPVHGYFLVPRTTADPDGKS